MDPTSSQSKDEDRPEFTASVVRDTAGLSYRQMNGWDNKRALPNQREDETRWRKYTARELFAIMVCAEIRSRFGSPVESLGFVRSLMLQEGANHLPYSVE